MVCELDLRINKYFFNQYKYIYLVGQGRADSRVSLQGDGDGEEHTGSGAHMGDAVE